MSKKIDPMKILLWDIETAPMTVATWGLFNQNISHDAILKDWYMICAAWQWYGDKKIETVSLLDDKKRFKADYTDDYHVTKTLHGILSNADVVVAHNGDHFDIKKFNARALYHGLEPLPNITTIDTLKVAKRNFKVSSNRLDYLGRFLGVGQKIENPKGLWLRALAGEQKAIKQMVKYNRGDISLLEGVYEKLLPYMQTHPNHNLFRANPDIPVCPKCGSTHLTMQGTRIATRLGTRQQWKCGSCGGWSTTRAMVRTADMR